MKNILFILFLLVASLTVDAQVNFMGIPVDGTATEMIQKLKNKGFYEIKKEVTYEMEGKTLPVLKGTFNGYDSNVYIATNKGKVYRVHIARAGTVSEAQIITDFNNLFYQFTANPKYYLLNGNKIDRKEDISYEMSCHNKQYTVVFYQILSDSIEEENYVWFTIRKLSYDEYWISIFYDNLKNTSNGEDL